MRHRWVLWSAVAATAVVAFSFATSDGALAGAVAATRNSARFSALVFALALAARAGRPVALAANQVELTLAFVAAHAIHYITIIDRAFVDPTSPLRHPSLEPFVVVAVGSG
ncbi:MAG TPA: hypothetical protein VG496_19785, partial [Myxococcales bacterium]|nr:hypothetical protein [Myxococcales bacterium]